MPRHGRLATRMRDLMVSDNQVAIVGVGPGGSVANQSVHHLFVVAERTMRGSEINHDPAAALWAVRVKHGVNHGEVDGIATHRRRRLRLRRLCQSLPVTHASTKLQRPTLVDGPW